MTAFLGNQDNVIGYLPTEDTTTTAIPSGTPATVFPAVSYTPKSDTSVITARVQFGQVTKNTGGLTTIVVTLIEPNASHVICGACMYGLPTSSTLPLSGVVAGIASWGKGVAGDISVTMEGQGSSGSCTNASASAYLVIEEVEVA